MIDRIRIVLILSSLVLSCLVTVSRASAGDADPVYRSCMQRCAKTGCVGERCFQSCSVPSDRVSKSLYLWWKELDCQSDCSYHCMVDREKEREALGYGPVKYHGKWPFKRVFGIQEPASVALSLLNLAVHFHGWMSLFKLLYCKLPLKDNKTPYYEYTAIWHIYGLLSINSWFWSSIFHSRDIDITEKLDYFSAVALLGCSLMVAIVRSFRVTDEAVRVMVAAPLLAFVTTHILFLSFYKMDYGWNMKVCVVMAALQLVIWSIWAGVTLHPSRWKLWFVVIGGGLALLLEIYDFPPYQGFIDAHALWHATTIPLAYVWWNFIKDDAEHRTSELIKKMDKRRMA